MDDFRSPLARKPPLRVDIPRNPFGQSPSVPNRHDGGGPAGASGAGANGTHGANNPGFAHEPVKTPVTPVEDSSRMVPHSEMFSDVSPAALLGDQVARLRLEQGSRGVDVRRPPRAPPTHHDRDEGGGGEVVIDIPVDVSPYMEMFMRPAPPSQGRVLCRVEVKQQKNGNTLYEMVIEESNVMLLVALHRAKQKDILISMYENDIENSHIGVMRPVQPGMFVLEGRRAGVRADPPWEYTCIAHGTHQTGDMPVMNMMEVAVPNCAYGESAFANGHNAPPSPSAAVAWPPGELERWLREHDDTQPQRDASLLTMRLPQWNPETKLLTLNFFERATCPSSKNFQLTPFGDAEKSVLLFGKRAEGTYSLDFMAPLSPFAAFGIALSVYDW